MPAFPFQMGGEQKHCHGQDLFGFSTRMHSRARSMRSFATKGRTRTATRTFVDSDAAPAVPGRGPAACIGSYPTTCIHARPNLPEFSKASHVKLKTLWNIRKHISGKTSYIIQRTSWFRLTDLTAYSGSAWAVRAVFWTGGWVADRTLVRDETREYRISIVPTTAYPPHSRVVRIAASAVRRMDNFDDWHCPRAIRKCCNGSLTLQGPPPAGV